MQLYKVFDSSLLIGLLIISVYIDCLCQK